MPCLHAEILTPELYQKKTSKKCLGSHSFWVANIAKRFFFSKDVVLMLDSEWCDRLRVLTVWRVSLLILFIFRAFWCLWWVGNLSIFKGRGFRKPVGMQKTWALALFSKFWPFLFSRTCEKEQWFFVQKMSVAEETQKGRPRGKLKMEKWPAVFSGVLCWQQVENLTLRQKWRFVMSVSWQAWLKEGMVRDTTILEVMFLD